VTVPSEDVARLARAGYTLEGEIGRGATSVVYLARQDLLDRRVALKRVGLAPEDGEGPRRRFEAEVAALIALDHPGVVRLMDVLRYGESAWFVMEYVAGPTLKRVLDLSGGVSTANGVAVVGQLAEVLDYLADRGVVHRDLKPANVLLTQNGRVKVGDLGIAVTDTNARLTRPGVVVGTPAYLSPEQASGRSDPSPASDLYSLGVIAYELIVGRVPFLYSGNILALLAAQESEPPPDPKSLLPQLPEEMAAALLAPLAKEPRERPITAREYRWQLERAADAAWPGWRLDVDTAQLAQRFSPPATPARARPTEEDDTATAGWEAAAPRSQPLAPSPPATRPAPVKVLKQGRRRSGWMLPVGVFVVAVAVSFLAIRAAVTDRSADLRIVSMHVSCSADAATAHVETNGKRGDLRYRWSPGGPGVLGVGSQPSVDINDPLAPASGSAQAAETVTFDLTSPDPRSASCVRGGRSSTG
jgi:predicted Ser/Thr protein kinase